MPSMPGPSSWVKNCDATLRRVTLSPLPVAMAAVRGSLGKKRQVTLWASCGQTGLACSAIAPTSGACHLPSLCLPCLPLQSPHPPMTRVCAPGLCLGEGAYCS